MAEVFFTELADEQLTRLEANASLGRLLARVDEVLTELEQDPGQEQLTRHEYRQLLDWALAYEVAVRGDGEDWVVLWTWHQDKPSDVVVIYVGAPPQG
ncbi:MAG: hypothetical protein ACYCST_03460 [Acidimicrobiales bacterium]